MDKIKETSLIIGIKQEEIDFPKRFASYEEKEYGILFYMADNKDSYDGNHACIYPDKITDLGAVLDDITEFYNKLGTNASIYHPFEKDYFKNNLETLKAHGYTYTAEDAVQDAFLCAWQRLDTLKDPARFGGWVCRIAKYRAVNLAKRYRVKEAQVLLILSRTRKKLKAQLEKEGYTL